MACTLGIAFALMAMSWFFEKPASPEYLVGVVLIALTALAWDVVQAIEKAACK